MVFRSQGSAIMLINTRNVRRAKVRKFVPKVVPAFVPASPTIEASPRAQAIVVPVQQRPPKFKNARVESAWITLKYYAIGLWDAIDEDNCFTYAAGISFNLLLSIIPLSLLLLQAFSILLLNNQHVVDLVLYRITSTIPVKSYRATAREALASMLKVPHNMTSVAGIIGVISLIWLGSSLFSTLRTTVNGIFRIKGGKSTLLLMARDFLFMGALMVLFLVLTLLFPVLRTLLIFGTSILPDWLIAFTRSIVPYAVSLGVSFVMYCVFFWILPYKQLPRKVVIRASIVTTILIEIMKVLFALSMDYSSTIGAMYGTYAFLVGIAMWVYYVSLVITISSEFGRLYWTRTIAEGVVPLPLVGEKAVDPQVKPGG